jgi:hypothetical protein
MSFIVQKKNIFVEFRRGTSEKKIKSILKKDVVENQLINKLTHSLVSCRKLKMV